MRDGWVEANLGEVAEWWSGGTPKAREPKYYENGTIPWAVISDMNKGVIDSTNSYITEEALDLIGGRLAPVGSVLISMYASVGKSAITNVPLATNQAIAWSIPKQEKIMPFFLYLVSQQLEKTISDLARGATQRNINRQMLREFTFLLPPLPEQKRIVDLISSVDSYIESLQQQLEGAKKSRNAVLHELLTAGGDDWIETTLGDASEVIMGRQLSPSKKLGTRPRPYIRAANIGSWGINLEDIYEMDFTEIEEERFACQVGDTILVEGGNEKSVGCPAFISEKESGLCIQNTVIRCRSTNPKRLDPNFQYHLLRFMFWRGDFAQLCAGTTIMHLGQKRAEVVPISIPPIGEQLDFVDTISKFDLVVSNLEKTLDNAKTLRSGLLSDLLSGEHEIPASYDKVMGAV